MVDGEIWRTYIKKRISNNKNFLCAVVGDTGSGKSWICQRAGELLNQDTYDPTKQTFFSFNDMLRAINLKNLKRGMVVILEEFGVQMGSRSWQSKDNISYSQLLQTFRNLGLVVFLNVPSFEFIDAQARSLMHALWVMEKIDYASKQSIVNAYLLQHNRKPKQGRHVYYKSMRAWIENTVGIKKPVAIRKIRFNRPSEHIIKRYEEMKEKFTDELNKKLHEKTKDKPKVDGRRVTRIDYDLMDSMITDGYKNKQIMKTLSCSEPVITQRRKDNKQNQRNKVKSLGKSPLEL